MKCFTGGHAGLAIFAILVLYTINNSFGGCGDGESEGWQSQTCVCYIEPLLLPYDINMIEKNWTVNVLILALQLHHPVSSTTLIVHYDQIIANSLNCCRMSFYAISY